MNTTENADRLISRVTESINLPLPLFAKEGHYSSLWHKEDGRDFTVECHGTPEHRLMPRAMTVFYVFLLCTVHCLLFTALSEAAIFDRVVAFVDDQAITLSELQEQFGVAKKLAPDITEEEVLNTMINRILLWRQAKKYRIEAPTRDAMIDEYVDLKVRAFIRVSEADIEEFYQKNQDKFAGKTLDSVRDEIEKYLTEKQLNSRLKETLKELRENAYVKIQLSPER